MKKVLSLLLICVMLLSCALVVNAAGEGYTFTAGSYTFGKRGAIDAFNAGDYTGTNVLYANVDDYDDEANGTEDVAYLVLDIATNITSPAGYVTLQFDETKVTPVYCDGYGMYPVTAAADGLNWDFTNNSQPIEDETKLSGNKILVTWQAKNASGNTGTIAMLPFALNTGVTTDDLDAATFTLVAADDAFITENNLKVGGAGIQDMTATIFDANETTTFTYPGDDVTVGGDDPIVPPAEDKWGKDETATVGTVTFPTTLVEGAVTETATSGARTQIAVFGKNATAKTLDDGDYWVQFNENKYLGKASTEAVTMWAIVIVDTTGEKMEADRTYSYTAGCGDQQWTGEVTVAQIAE